VYSEQGNPTQELAMSWSFHYPDDHEEFPHFHINKLMIIAKGENHTQNTRTNRKGKLE